MPEVFFGYDPGGNGANGVAVLHAQAGGSLTGLVGTVDSVDEAVEWFQNNVGAAEPRMVGIDTYLSWATTQCGWRPMDTYLRQTYPVVQYSVFASNSAAGSMAVQGMAMALRLRQIWRTIRLNETHPKVQYFALSQQPYLYGQPMVTWLANQIGIANPPAITNDHEWDALFSAWACWRIQQGAWTHDLMPQQHNLLLPAGSVTYFWP